MASIPVVDASASRDEAIARVAWAAHILSYLAGRKRHIELGNPEDTDSDDENDDEPEFDNPDARSERATVLQGSSTSISSKFLDCVAQLWSPSKGWGSVTAVAMCEREDYIEIRVARNDCFGLASDNGDGQFAFAEVDSQYCEKFRAYLSSDEQDQDSPDSFELSAIAYTKDRIDHWVADLRTLLGPSSKHQMDRKALPKHQLAIKTWTSFSNLLHRQDLGEIQFREMIVLDAYDCVNLPEVQDVIGSVLKEKVATKVWKSLRFLARPLSDCRLVKQIAQRLPQFQQANFEPAYSGRSTEIAAEFLIDIGDAWTRLSTETPSPADIGALTKFNNDFKVDCAKSYSLHAEAQIVSDFESRPSLTPTVRYFGCSKKACLLCDSLLRGLPEPITTRGAHGVCYPAWGVPFTKTSRIAKALESMEKMLVARIQAQLSASVTVRKSHLVAARVAQSTNVSDLSKLTLRDLSEREEQAENERLAEKERVTDRRVLDGAGAVQRSTADRLESIVDPDTTCVMCNREPAWPCLQCRSSYFCSDKCQNSDWPSHRHVCKAFSQLGPRPSQNHKRAFFFPEEGRPKIIWLLAERHEDDSDPDAQPYELLNLGSLLGPGKPHRGHSNIEHNAIRGRNMGAGFVSWVPRREGYAISLNYRDNYLADGSRNNMSLATVVGSSGALAHPWKGPIIAVRETPSECYDDITLGDLRHIVDHVLSYANDTVREIVEEAENRPFGVVRGVKICCVGEMRLHGTDNYVPVEVPKSHETRLGSQKGDTSSISELLGLPIRLWKFPDSDMWRDLPGWQGEVIGAASNQDVAFFMLETDPRSSSWGWAPMKWNHEIGNVLATRVDGKDLDVDDVEWMCGYARNVLLGRFENVLDQDGDYQKRQRVLESITRKGLLEYKDQSRKEEEEMRVTYEEMEEAEIGSLET